MLANALGGTLSVSRKLNLTKHNFVMSFSVKTYKNLDTNSFVEPMKYFETLDLNEESIENGNQKKDPIANRDVSSYFFPLGSDL